MRYERKRGRCAKVVVAEARKTVKSLRARIREIKFYNWSGEIFHKIVN